MAAAGRVLPAKITYDRDLHLEPIERGGLIWRGQDGKTRATILEYDPKRNAPISFDTVVEGTIVDHGTYYELSGISERLINEAGLPRGEAQVTIKITPLRDCKDCR